MIMCSMMTVVIALRFKSCIGSIILLAFVYDCSTGEKLGDNTIRDHFRQQLAFLEENFTEDNNIVGTEPPSTRYVTKFNGGNDNNSKAYNKKNNSYGLAGREDNTKNKYPPKFKHPSKLYNIDRKPAGSSIQFKCTADGNPIPNITWFKNNGPIERVYFQPTYGKWWMSLEELSKTDDGDYTCLICNELGCISHTVNLYVQERYPSKPYIKEGHPGNITAVLNDTVTLSCPPISDLEPYVYWLKAYDNFTGAPLRLDKTSQLYQMDMKLSDDPADKPEILTIANLTQEDQGWYVCVAINTLGYDSAKGFLTVLNGNEEKKNIHANEKLTQANNNQLVAGIVTVVVVLLLAIIINIGLTIYRTRKTRVMVKYWIKNVTVEKPQSESGELVMPIVKIEKQRLANAKNTKYDTTVMSEYQMPVDARWEIPRSKISLTGHLLGEGEFGKVVKAESHGVMVDDAKTVVAIKMLKDSYTDADMISLVSEMEIMKMIGKHENIINLLGCCTQDGPLYVVMEYARNGSLREYLRMHKPHKNNASTENLLDKPLAHSQLTDFVWQVAKGMEYLASRGCIHRDLAARNVLVSADLVLKIADFGLARDVRDTVYYRKCTAGKLPMKWMAPESIAQNYYDKRSDVWSFGVITWEIMTFSDVPYSKISVYKLYNHLETNNRLEKPDDCSNEMYDLMKSCWAFKPENRPTFEEIVGNMKTMLNLTENGPPKENFYDYVTMLA